MHSFIILPLIVFKLSESLRESKPIQRKGFFYACQEKLTQTSTLDHIQNSTAVPASNQGEQRWLITMAVLDFEYL